jgi:hypothetical protein
MLAWKKAKNPQAVAAFLQWKNKNSHAGVPLSICMSSYATLNPPTPVPPLNLKGPSDLCPRPIKPYKAPLGYFSYSLLLCPGTILSKLLWRKVSVANQFFTNTFIVLSFAAPVKHLLQGVLFGLNYIITIFSCLQKLALK